MGHGHALRSTFSRARNGIWYGLRGQDSLALVDNWRVSYDHGRNMRVFRYAQDKRARRSHQGMIADCEMERTRNEASGFGMCLSLTNKMVGVPPLQTGNGIVNWVGDAFSDGFSRYGALRCW